MGSSLLATNAGWGGPSAIASAAASLGAFAWADPSRNDAALMETLTPGPHTARVSRSSGDTGIAFAGVYDATPDGMATPDSALLLTLAPGPYAANVTGASGDTGVAVIEIYEVR